MEGRFPSALVFPWQEIWSLSDREILEKGPPACLRSNKLLTSCMLTTRNQCKRNARECLEVKDWGLTLDSYFGPFRWFNELEKSNVPIVKPPNRTLSSGPGPANLARVVGPTEEWKHSTTELCQALFVRLLALTVWATIAHLSE